MLTIRLLGAVEWHRNGTPMGALAAPRLQALALYLLLRRGVPQSRAHLAFLFWPDTSEAQARTNLRNLLAQLRQAIPALGDYLEIEAHTLRWRSPGPYSLDVAAFEEAVAAARATADHARRRALLLGGLEHYGGDLAPGSYDDWLLPERDRLRQLYQQALEELVALLAAARDDQLALAYARRLLHSDPLREASYGLLMELYAATGDRAAALQAYRRCAELLVRELGVEPGPELRARYESLSAAQGAPIPALFSAPAPQLVGRDEPWAWLRGRWREAQGGRPLLAVIHGEAGIGKTSLVDAFLTWAERQGVGVARARCYAAAGSLALAPVREWLACGLFRPTLAALDPALRAELGPLLPDEAAAPMAVVPAGVSDAWQRQRLFAALARVVLADERPLLLCIDDLQWCDAETRDLLHQLLRFRPRARLLLLVTLRDEDVLPDHPLALLFDQLRRSDELAELALGRLSSDETARLAATLLGRQPDSAELARLYAATEGNPLFVVETLRAGVEGLGKIQAVIRLRLATLSTPARELVNLAAVIGRAFAVGVLAHASELGDQLALVLDELWQRKIVQPRDDELYDFTHDRLRAVALASLSPVTRRRLHRRVADALAAVAGRDLDQASATIAAHYDEAGAAALAIPFYRRGAALAHRLAALGDAIAMLQRALALLAAQPDAEATAREELAVQLALGPMLLAQRGYSAPEVGQTLRRALELCAGLGTEHERFRVLWGLGRYYLVLPDLAAGLATGEELLRIAEGRGDPALLLEAHNSLGAIQFHRGELAAARAHLEAAIARYDPALHRGHALMYGQEPGVVSFVRLGWTCWWLGEHDAARAHGDAALALARASEHPFSLAFALAYRACLHQFAHEPAACVERAAEAEALAAAAGFPLFQGMAEQLRGWGLALQGRLELGLPLLAHGLEQFRASGAELGLPYFYRLHAEARLAAGQIAEARALAELGLAVLARTHEGWAEAALISLLAALAPD